MARFSTEAVDALAAAFLAARRSDSATVAPDCLLLGLVIVPSAAARLLSRYGVSAAALRRVVLASHGPAPRG